MPYDVFISYSIKDKAVADAIRASLEAKRMRCWIAPRDVLPGIPYAESLIEGMNQSRTLVLVFSANSNNSPQVMREIERAVYKGIPIIPVQIEDVVPTKAMEYFISSSHWLEAITPPLESHLKKLADTVQTLLASQSRRLTEELPVDGEAAGAVRSALHQSSASITKPLGKDDEPAHTPSHDEASAVHIALTSNLSGALCYIASLISGVLFLIAARKDGFVRFHAWQSILLSAVLIMGIILFELIPEVRENSIQYWVLYAVQVLFFLLIVFLSIFLIVRGYKGHATRIPLIGSLAWKLANPGK